MHRVVSYFCLMILEDSNPAEKSYDFACLFFTFPVAICLLRRKDLYKLPNQDS